MRDHQVTDRRSFFTTAAGATALGAAGSVGCRQPTVSHEDKPGSGMRLDFVAHGSNADAFWGAQHNGFMDFCAAYGIHGRFLGTRLDGDIGEMLANLDSVLSGPGDGLTLPISNANTFTEPIQRAIDKGLAVVAVNIPDFRPQEERLPYVRYVGGEPIATGEENARMTVKAFTKLAGRAPKRAVYLNHVPGVEVLDYRGQGMQTVFDTTGTQFDTLVIHSDPASAQDTIRAYVRKHPDLETIQTGNSRPAAWAIQALREMEQLGKHTEPFSAGRIYVGSIDIDPELLELIAAGECLGTIDEQPYMQGWYAAQLLYHWIKYKFIPGRDISTGPLVVQEKTLVESLIEQARQGIRA